MAAKNLYHDLVVAGLVADGWTITDDPLTVMLGRQALYIDLGVEAPTLVAEQAGRKVAIEIQSFLSGSAVNDLHRAVGQFVIYRAVLDEVRPGLPLYLAIPHNTFAAIFDEPLGQLIQAKLVDRLVVFERTTGRIMKWIG
jgi:XisH protein